MSYQIPGHTFTLPPRRESNAASANERESVGNADQSNDDIDQTNESEPALENESIETGANNEASNDNTDQIASENLSVDPADQLNEATKDLSALTAITSVSELEQFCSGLSDSRLSEVAEKFLDFQAQ